MTLLQIIKSIFLLLFLPLTMVSCDTKNNDTVKVFDTLCSYEVKQFDPSIELDTLTKQELKQYRKRQFRYAKKQIKSNEKLLKSYLRNNKKVEAYKNGIDPLENIDNIIDSGSDAVFKILSPTETIIRAIIENKQREFFDSSTLFYPLNNDEIEEELRMTSFTVDRKSRDVFLYDGYDYSRDTINLMITSYYKSKNIYSKNYLQVIDYFTGTYDSPVMTKAIRIKTDEPPIKAMSILDTRI